MVGEFSTGDRKLTLTPSLCNYHLVSLLPLGRGSCHLILQMKLELERNTSFCLFVLTKKWVLGEDVKRVPRELHELCEKDQYGLTLPLPPLFFLLRRLHGPDSRAHGGFLSEKANKHGERYYTTLENETKNSPSDKTVIKLHLTVSSQ